MTIRRSSKSCTNRSISINSRNLQETYLFPSRKYGSFPVKCSLETSPQWRMFFLESLKECSTVSRKTIPNLANLQKVIESRDHQLFEAAGSNYISEPPRCRATRLPRILKRLSEKFAPLRGTAGQVVSIIPHHHHHQQQQQQQQRQPKSAWLAIRKIHRP